jgi:ATP-dependent DNA helicase RecQ
MQNPSEILKQYWGYSAFREMQADIVDSVLAGYDTLALLPTGGGKSVCFQVPALCMDGICIVVSPLIALMKDQVLNLEKRGISAAAIYTGMHFREIDRIFENAVQNQYKFLYLSPERLATELFLERVKKMKVSLIAVDEAHCISQWGYDFRPSYLNISNIRAILPEVPVIALTATATKEVVEDIQQKLLFKEDKKVFKKSFSRQNLAYIVLEEEDKRSKMLDILKKTRGSAVVYVLNRKETKDISNFLNQHQITSGYYHAGLDSDYRSMIQDSWIRNEFRVIVATNAFGMGIDKPDVRVVIHLTMPESLEAYFQEAGRAGRDGEKAFGILLYNQSDRNRLEQNFENSYPPITYIKQVYRAIGSYFQLAIGAGLGNSYDFDLTDFCKKNNFLPVNALSALKILMRSALIELSDAVFTPSSVQIIVDNKMLYDFMLRNPKSEKLIKLMMRSYQGIFNHNVNIREKQLAHGLGITESEVCERLAALQKERIIDYKPFSDKPSLTFLTDRQDADYLVLNKEEQEFLKNRAEIRVKSSLHYAETVECRSRMLLSYFDEKNAPKCGSCDVCSGRHEKPDSMEIQNISDSIKKIIKAENVNMRALISKFNSSKELKALKILEQLIDNGQVKRDSNQNLLWKD